MPVYYRDKTLGTLRFVKLYNLSKDTELRPYRVNGFKIIPLKMSAFNRGYKRKKNHVTKYDSLLLTTNSSVAKQLLVKKCSMPRYSRVTSISRKETIGSALEDIHYLLQPHFLWYIEVYTTIGKVDKLMLNIDSFLANRI